MNYYSTNNRNLSVGLRQAVVKGLAPDNGLFMPEKIPVLPRTFFDEFRNMSFRDMAFEIARGFVGSEVAEDQLKKIIHHTVSFDAPLIGIENGIAALELFHGPTLAFKDFGARFLSQLLGYFASEQGRTVTILAATSGDTGSAVANGFLDVPNTRVVVLYPSGKVSDIQEKQFATLGRNITALEVDGTFDDCQALVKQAFGDAKLNERMFLTSANSINIARLIPQTFYYFYAVSRSEHGVPVVFSVPSGNFGNLTAGIIAKRMGLTVSRFIAATNINDVVPTYLASGVFSPRPGKPTVSNAMDVGNPSNFARLLDLYSHDRDRVLKDITGFSFSDKETMDAMSTLFRDYKYLVDPHGAVAFLGLKEFEKKSREPFAGIFLHTAHPGKFRAVVEKAIAQSIELPDALGAFMDRRKLSERISRNFAELKDRLLAL